MSDADAVRAADLEVRPPKQERSRAAWNRVLDAGVAILEDGGYDAFTIAAVCERAARRADGHLRAHDQQGRAVPGRLRARDRTAPGRAARVRRRGALGRAGARCARPVGGGRDGRDLAAPPAVSRRHRAHLRRARGGGAPRGPLRPGARGRVHPASSSGPRMPSRIPIPRPRSAPASRRCSPRRSFAWPTGPVSRRRRRWTTTRTSPTWGRRRCATSSPARPSDAPGSG